MKDEADTQKPDSTPSAEELEKFRKSWVGTTKDKDGVVREIRSMKGDKPFMATFDKDGKPTGFGIV